MTGCRTKIAAVAASLIAATQAYGGTAWEATSSTSIASAPPLDIEKVTVRENRSSYIVDMYLKGKPSPFDKDIEYSIYIGPFNTLPGGSADRGKSNWIKVSSDSLLAAHLVDPVGHRKVPTFRAEFSDRTNKLEWVIDKRDFVTAPTQFYGVAEKGFHTVDRTSVGKIVGSPIPTAAWLLASGVLSLIGLKRKDLPSR